MCAPACAALSATAFVDAVLAEMRRSVTLFATVLVATVYAKAAAATWLAPLPCAVDAFAGRHGAEVPITPTSLS